MCFKKEFFDDYWSKTSAHTLYSAFKVGFELAGEKYAMDNTEGLKSEQQIVEGDICDYCVNQGDFKKCGYCPDHNFEAFVGRKLKTCEDKIVSTKVK